MLEPKKPGEEGGELKQPGTVAPAEMDQNKTDKPAEEKEEEKDQA